MFHDLTQTWPAPTTPKPIVLIGAGGIVRDAHLPAYEKAGFTVTGIADLDLDRAQSLARDWNIPSVYHTVAEATKTHNTNVVYDIATPPHVITAILPELPDNAAVLIQKPWRRSEPGA